MSGDNNQERVGFEVRENVVLLSINNPPVNAIGSAVRKAIFDGLDRAVADDRIKAIVLMGKGRLFSAGADIKEFGKPPKEPVLATVLEMMDSCRKPIIAALHGAVLGAALETALTCHFRIASASATFGLPEVKLGLLPGGGGTQRLPRIVGPQKALEMITIGNSIDAEDALDSGLIDEIITGDLLGGAFVFAEKIIKEARPLRRSGDMDEKVKDAGGFTELFEKYRVTFTRKARNFKAPMACIHAVQASLEMPLGEGLEFERQLFEELKSGSQSAAQRHYFFAERKAGVIPGIPKPSARSGIRKAAVIGAGTMGGGITMSFLNAGIPVTLVETRQDALQRGLDAIRKNYEITASKGKMTRNDVNTRMSLIRPTLAVEDVADADLVVEAVFEDMGLKKEIFSKLDVICGKEAILATNTSYLDVNEIAAVTRRPENVLGLHFFSPANVMPLLEIVRAEKTSPQVLAGSLALAKQLNKIAVVVGVCYGFAANRMYAQRKRESKQLVLEGALPSQVDRVLFDFGFPMGPFALCDLVGLDLGLDPAGSMGRKLDDQLCKMGRRGLKSGSGYYAYEPGSRKPVPDPAVEELIIEVSEKENIKRREISDEEILQRCIYSIINEGARIVAEGIVVRPSDLDVIWVNGFGWPQYLGGPMFYADMIGLDNVLGGVQKYQQKFGNTWKPATLLEKLVKSGKSFQDISDNTI
jgi:3-hydroxyacyl-CoA dehydrogenase